MLDIPGIAVNSKKPAPDWSAVGSPGASVTIVVPAAGVLWSSCGRTA